MPDILNTSDIKVYTAICGTRDDPRTDIECFDFYPWLTLPVLQAKVFKVLYYQFLGEPYSIWVDGNITLTVEPEKVVELFLEGDADIGVWKHWGRNCIFTEALAIADCYGEAVGNMAIRQAKHYRDLGFPSQAGLAECNVVVRKDSPRVRAFCDKWWAEITAWGFRDQISFPYVRSLFPDLKINLVEGNPREHEYFKYKDHNVQAGKREVPCV